MKEPLARLQRFPEKPPISQATKDAIIKLYKSGIGIKPIKNQLSASQRTIYRTLNEAGIPIRERGYPGGNIKPDIKDEIERLYLEENISTREIADRLGVNAANVWSILNKRGVRIRSRSEAGVMSVQKRGIGTTRRGLSAPWYSEKAGGWIRADSRYELVRMSQLDNDPNVVYWTKAAVERVPYSEGRYYVPDFYIEYKDGKKVVEEIKPIYCISDENILQKESAARKYFNAKQIEYKIVTENDIGINNLRNFDYDNIPLLTTEEKNRFKLTSSKSDYCKQIPEAKLGSKMTAPTIPQSPVLPVTKDYPDLARIYGKTGNHLPPVKEPWQMTREEFKKTASPLQNREDFVKAWLRDNENIPNKVRRGINQIPQRDGALLVYGNEKGEPVSMLSFRKDAVDAIAVSDRYTNRGIATQLLEESRKYGVRRTEGPISPEFAGIAHRFAVKTAFLECKPIPPEVLREYPDLMLKAEKQKWRKV